MTSAPSRFREDINALRAIAVVIVVLFHYGVWPFGGGYIGVDIFFVISGYLMTRIIVSRATQGRLSILGFYGDRVRRIVPALVSLVLVLLVAGYVLLDPLAFGEFAHQAATSIAFLSNIQFWNEAGYFDTSSDTKWLLHTWSLSVEWQFYLIYPLILGLLWKIWPFLKVLRAAVWIGGLLSLALCVFLSLRLPSAAFFLLPPRAWEMLAGGIVALYPVTIKNRATMQVITAVAVAVIALCTLAFDRFTLWPSALTVLPVVATAAIIAVNASASGWVRLAPIQIVGSWSYSIYLWHWPVAVAARYFDILQSPVLKIAALAVLMGVGAIVLRIWTRLRVPASLRDSQVATTLGAACVVAAAAVLVWQSDGLPQRQPTDAALFSEFRRATSDWAFPLNCSGVTRAGVLLPCAAGAASDPDNDKILVIGDSLAQAVYARWAGDGTDQVKTAASLTFVTNGGCPILIGIGRLASGGRCDLFLTKALEEAASGRFKRVVFTSLWSGYVASHPEDLCWMADGQCDAIDAADRPAKLRQSVTALGERMRQLTERNIEVHVLLSFPFSRFDVPHEMSKRLFLKRSVDDVAAIDRVSFQRTDAVLRDQIAAAAAAAGAHLIDPVQQMCDVLVCATVRINGAPLYKDNVHIRASVIRSDKFRFLDELVERNADPSSLGK